MQLVALKVLAIALGKGEESLKYLYQEHSVSLLVDVRMVQWHRPKKLSIRHRISAGVCANQLNSGLEQHIHNLLMPKGRQFNRLIVYKIPALKVVVPVSSIR